MATELHAADSGARLSVRVGDRTTIRLPESPTTGYRWHADVDQGRLRVVEDRFDGAPSPRGAAGDRVLVVEAISTGEARLRLVKHRSWEPAAPPSDEFAVDLDVGPRG